MTLRKHNELVAQLFQKLQEQANVTIYDQVLQALVDEQSQARQT